MTKTEMLEFCNEELLDTLVSNRYLRKIDAKPEPFYVIFTDVKLRRFIPKYLVNVIKDKLERKQISLEIAQSQLQYLYDSKLN